MLTCCIRRAIRGVSLLDELVGVAELPHEFLDEDVLRGQEGHVRGHYRSAGRAHRLQDGGEDN